MLEVLFSSKPSTTPPTENFWLLPEATKEAADAGFVLKETLCQSDWYEMYNPSKTPNSCMITANSHPKDAPHPQGMFQNSEYIRGIYIINKKTNIIVWRSVCLTQDKEYPKKTISRSKCYSFYSAPSQLIAKYFLNSNLSLRPHNFAIPTYDFGDKKTTIFYPYFDFARQSTYIYKEEKEYRMSINEPDGIRSICRLSRKLPESWCCYELKD